MNEEQVGKAIRESGALREEKFLPTKPTNHHDHKVSESLQESLGKLGVEYADMYLIHWPQAYTEDNKMVPFGESPTYVETWRDKEKLLGTDKVRSVRVSNFSVALLEVLLNGMMVVVQHFVCRRSI